MASSEHAIATNGRLAATTAPGFAQERVTIPVTEAVTSIVALPAWREPQSAPPSGPPRRWSRSRAERELVELAWALAVVERARQPIAFGALVVIAATATVHRARARLLK